MPLDCLIKSATVVDGTGAVVERFAYDPFGSVTVYDTGYTVRAGGSGACARDEREGRGHHVQAVLRVQVDVENAALDAADARAVVAAVPARVVPAVSVRAPAR